MKGVQESAKVLSRKSVEVQPDVFVPRLRDDGASRCGGFHVFPRTNHRVARVGLDGGRFDFKGHNDYTKEYPGLGAISFPLRPYLDWTEREGIPVVEDFGVDLNQVETKPWARMGADGASVHLKGRGDSLCIFLIDFPPGGKTEPQRHLIEEVVYVLDGHGSTTIKTQDGKTHSFEWSKGSLFALPLNAQYQHFNDR